MNQRVKDKVKSVLPASCVKKIREFRNNVNLKKSLAQSKKDIRSNLSVLRRKVEHGDKINVAFLIQFPEMWNSEKSIYEALKEDPRFSVIVIAVPEMQNDKNQGMFQENPAYSFLKENQIDVINAYHNGKFYQIDEDIDYIFLQRPYDVLMPKCYRFKKLSKLALLCYTPYSGRVTKGIHVNIEFNDTFLPYMYSIFADCKESYEFVKSWYQKYKCDEKKVYDIGFPRNDLLFNFSAQQTNGNVFLWLPRWSLDPYHDMSHFLDYIDVLLDDFEVHQDRTLVIRPHPLMFSNFLANGAMTADQIEALKDRIEHMENVSFDHNKNYMKTFQNCDYLISDKTSLLVEFFVTQKPVIFCDAYQNEELTNSASQMVQTFYNIANSEELLSTIAYLSEGNDKNKAFREVVSRETVKYDGKAGKHIVDAIASVSDKE